MSYAKKLAGLKENWKAAKPATGGGQLPAGKYQFQIAKAQLQESKASFNKGNLQVVYSLVVATGKLKGRKATIFCDLESDGKNAKGEEMAPPGMSIFMGHLENLEIDKPKDLSEGALKKVLTSMIGLIFNGAAVSNAKGYTNIYINGLVHAAEDEDDEEVEEEDEEEVEEEEEEEDEEEEDDEPEPPKKKAKKGGKKKPEPEEDEEEEEEEEEDEWESEFD